MAVAEEYINNLLKNIISQREVPVRAAKFMVGKIGNDDDPNTKLIQNRCDCKQADVKDKE